ncbi:MAG TPA: patatin-like phospholipase family protein [Pseudonocardiaceae bacterium]|nr:patatin-like phospholipase family protein [Pseudonocardiaceae bacterium]
MISLPRPVGFVFGGGGSLGAMQVGMLRALLEAGIAADLVVGTSVGSLNGTLLARHGNASAEPFVRIWASMTRRAVFPGGLLRQARTLHRGRNHLYGNAGLARVIAEHVGDDTTFAQLPVPLGVVTMDVDTAQPVLVREGRLVPALLASCAIPGIYPPVELDGRTCYDGGVVANVPMTQAVAMGAKSLVVLDCAFPGHLPGAPRSLPDVLMFTAMINMRNQAVLEAPLVAADLPVVYLPGPAPVRMTPLDFSHTDTLIEQAYRSAREHLAGLKVDGPGLYGAPGKPVS